MNEEILASRDPAPHPLVAEIEMRRSWIGQEPVVDTIDGNPCIEPLEAVDRGV